VPHPVRHPLPRRRDVRRRIARQLNKGENLHAPRRTLAYAGESAARRRRHEQQSETDVVPDPWQPTQSSAGAPEYHGLGVAALRRGGRPVDDEVLAHIWPSQHENVHFYGTHSVDIDGELAKPDAGRLPAAATRGRRVDPGAGDTILTGTAPWPGQHQINCLALFFPLEATNGPARPASAVSGPADWTTCAGLPELDLCGVTAGADRGPGTLRRPGLGHPAGRAGPERRIATLTACTHVLAGHDPR
jgi:Tn3 transposase DDE domain